MAIDVVRTRERTEMRTASGSRHVLEVSDVPATRVAEYAREAADGDGRSDVYLERKGGQTFLVAD